MIRYTLSAKKNQLLQWGFLSALTAAVLLSPVVGTSVALALPQFSTNPVELSQVQGGSTDRLPRSVARRVRREVAQRYNVPARNLQIVSFSRETWSEGCLGLGAPHESCLMMLVDGWRVEVSSGQQNWVYRTDKTARMIRLEPPTQAVNLPSEVSDRLLQTIARQEKVPLNSLRVTEAQSATWDGCMGIFEPDQMCTQIAIFGWRAIVTDGDRSWVYHLSQDGSQIVQNITASGSRGGLIPTFIPSEQADENQGTAIVFYAAETGSLSGQISERILMANGSLYRHIRQPNVLPPSEPVVEKRLSPKQVEQFRQVLLQQKFPNLRGLRYVSSVSLADYPTMTLKGLGSTVDYTDLELENLPPALQTVIRAWEQL